MLTFRDSGKEIRRSLLQAELSFAGATLAGARKRNVHVLATFRPPPRPPPPPAPRAALCARYSGVTESLINIRTAGWPVWLALRCAAWWAGMHPRRMHMGGREWNRERARGRERKIREREAAHSESLRTNCNITIITRPLVGSSVHPSVCQNVLTLQRYQRTAGRSWRLRYAHDTTTGVPQPVSVLRSSRGRLWAI